MKNLVDYYIKFTERVRDINEAAKESPAELVEQTENLYRKRMGEIANYIVSSGTPGNKIITIAGPSGSGKTTTAAILIEELRALGMGAVRLSLDEFYRPNHEIPRGEDGEPDYETIDALDLDRVHECLLGLAVDGECTIPRYNFGKGEQLPPVHIKLAENEAVVVEGLHALNPAIVDYLPPKNSYTIYISVKQGICVGDDEVISAYDIRLCRRIVRDMMFRSISPEETFDMWDKVVAGESKYINPYKRFATITINSLHIYEPCVLAQIVMPLLSRISPDSERYEQAQELRQKLAIFETMPHSYVPQNSLLREFIGGGIY